MKKMSWYVGAIVGTAAALVVISTGPASAAGRKASVTSGTSAEVASTLYIGGSTVAVTSRTGLRPRIWEW